MRRAIQDVAKHATSHHSASASYAALLPSASSIPPGARCSAPAVHRTKRRASAVSSCRMQFSSTPHTTTANSPLPRIPTILLRVV